MSPSCCAGFLYPFPYPVVSPIRFHGARQTTCIPSRFAPYAEDTHQYKVDVATFWLLELEDLNSSFPGYYMEMLADANLGALSLSLI